MKDFYGIPIKKGSVVAVLKGTTLQRGTVTDLDEHLGYIYVQFHKGFRDPYDEDAYHGDTITIRTLSRIIVLTNRYARLLKD
jgi:hypothetical protein